METLAQGQFLLPHSAPSLSARNRRPNVAGACGFCGSEISVRMLHFHLISSTTLPLLYHPYPLTNFLRFIPRIIIFQARSLFASPIHQILLPTPEATLNVSTKQVATMPSAFALDVSRNGMEDVAGIYGLKVPLRL